ncbi:MAG: LytR/AlgR family response regulator transcription factor, partial [Cellulosilyticaceae bacterium]
KEYVFQSFDTNARYYFVKNDLSLPKFEEIFLDCISKSRQKKQYYICFKSNGQLIKLSQDHIKYFEVIKRIIYIYCKDGTTYHFYDQLQSLTNKVSPSKFIRTHRSYLVNIEEISSIQKNMLYLLSGEQLPVGRKYHANLHTHFLSYLHQDA